MLHEVVVSDRALVVRVQLLDHEVDLRGGHAQPQPLHRLVELNVVQLAVARGVHSLRKRSTIPSHFAYKALNNTEYICKVSLLLVLYMQSVLII